MLWSPIPTCHAASPSEPEPRIAALTTAKQGIHLNPPSQHPLHPKKRTGQHSYPPTLVSTLIKKDANDFPHSFNMDSLLKTIFPCLPIGNGEGSIRLPIETEKHQYHIGKPAIQPSAHGTKTPHLTSEEAATSIVSAMLTASKPGPSLHGKIQSLVHQAGGWSEYLASKVLSGLEAVLKAGKDMAPAMQEAYDKACEAAKKIKGFAADHPIATAVFCTVIALGILVVLAPYMLDLLGFAELGPVEGSWAARWMSMYGGAVPKGSLFSFLQRLGMTLK
ncbi:hypothetical protein N7G274_006652 [Stereocaulon virgatum]|uniref:Type II secretion system protein GspF domain-containing protein n=1 Tax=Stereocaulon virgatum TaxID=373712 RepID=A0ABR4ABF9_9LECA